MMTETKNNWNHNEFKTESAPIDPAMFREIKSMIHDFTKSGNATKTEHKKSDGDQKSSIAECDNMLNHKANNFCVC